LRGVYYRDSDAASVAYITEIRGVYHRDSDSGAYITEIPRGVYYRDSNAARVRGDVRALPERRVDPVYCVVLERVRESVRV